MKKKFINLKIEYIVPFVIFVLWFYFIGNNFLNETFLIDDYHWFRTFSNDHLKDSWYKNWDLDDIETRAYRPVALYLYHIQGLLFGENVILYHSFSILLMLVLILTIITFLQLLDFSKNEICFFCLIIIFSKIFTTLASWITINPLIVCYILFFLSGIFYLKWIRNYNFKFLILVVIISIIGILIREELYHIFFFLFLIAIYKLRLSELSKNFKSIFFSLFVIFIVTLILYYLRYIFVQNTPQPNIRVDNILAFLLTVVSSGLPGGVFTYTTGEKISQIFWVLGLLSVVAHTVFFKNYSFDFIKNFFILFLLICLTSLPSSVMARDFGIFLPSVFCYMLITKIIFNFLQSNFKSKLYLFYFILFFGVYAGYNRSMEHLKTWSFNSSYMVWLNSGFIFPTEKKITIPETRKNNAINKLHELNIKKKLDFQELLDLINDKKVSSKIYHPRHGFLKH